MSNDAAAAVDVAPLSTPITPASPPPEDVEYVGVGMLVGVGAIVGWVYRINQLSLPRSVFRII